MVETKFEIYDDFVSAVRNNFPTSKFKLKVNVETVIDDTGKQIGEFDFIKKTGTIRGEKSVTPLPPTSMSSFVSTL